MPPPANSAFDQKSKQTMKRVKHQQQSESSPHKRSESNHESSSEQILAEHEHQVQVFKAKLAEIDTEHLFALNGIARIHARKFLPTCRETELAKIFAHQLRLKENSAKAEHQLSHNFQIKSAAAALTPVLFCQKHGIKKIPFAGIDGSDSYPTVADLSMAANVVLKFLKHRKRIREERKRIDRVTKILRPVLCAWMIRRKHKIEKLAKRWANADAVKVEKQVAKRIETAGTMIGGDLASSNSLFSTSLRQQSTINTSIGIMKPSTPLSTFNGSSSSSPSRFVVVDESSPLLLHAASASASSAAFGSLRMESSIQLASENQRKHQQSLFIAMDVRKRMVGAWLRQQHKLAVKARRNWKEKNAVAVYCCAEYCSYNFNSFMVLPQILRQIGVESPPELIHLDSMVAMPGNQIFPQLREMHTTELKREQEEADRAVRDAERREMEAKRQALLANVNELRRKSISGVGSQRSEAAAERQRLIEEKFVPSSPASAAARTTTKITKIFDDEESAEAAKDRNFIFSLTEQSNTLQTPRKKKQQQQQTVFTASLDDQPFMKSLIPHHVFAFDERKVPMSEITSRYLKEYEDSKKSKTGRGFDVLFDFSSVRRQQFQPTVSNTSTTGQSSELNKEKKQEYYQAPVAAVAKNNKQVTSLGGAFEDESTRETVSLMTNLAASTQTKSMMKPSGTTTTTTHVRKNEKAGQFISRSSRVGYLDSIIASHHQQQEQNQTQSRSFPKASFLPEINNHENNFNRCKKRYF